MTDIGALYGKSLYDLAAEENVQDEIMADMEEVQELFNENPDYIRLLSEPEISKKERISLLDEAFKGQIQVYLLNFLKVLTEKNLLQQYSSCRKTYRKLYNEANGIAEAHVVSAVELNEDEKERLLSKLEKKSGKKVVMTTKIDPDILGGLQVELEGTLYDGSVKGRMTGIRKSLDELVL